MIGSRWKDKHKWGDEGYAFCVLSFSCKLCPETLNLKANNLILIMQTILGFLVRVGVF
jgi:hypothetical protein